VFDGPPVKNLSSGGGSAALIHRNKPRCLFSLCKRPVFLGFWRSVLRDRKFYYKLPPPHNQIYSRFWYAFSLFLRNFYSIKPFNGNFCELGRAGSLRKRWNFHLRLYFRPNSDRFRTRSGAVRRPCTMNVRNEPVQEIFRVKMWNPPPYGGGNFVNFNIEKACQFRE